MSLSRNGLFSLKKLGGALLTVGSNLVAVNQIKHLHEKPGALKGWHPTFGASDAFDFPLLAVHHHHLDTQTKAKGPGKR